MSLTFMLKEPEVRNLFRSTFDFEPCQTSAVMAVAPPPENRPSIGAAFDYLARFWLKRQHPDAVTGPWQVSGLAHPTKSAARITPFILQASWAMTL